MKLQIYLSRINWRQLLVHFFAGVFFVHAFTAFSYLNDPRFIIAYRNTGDAAMKTLMANGVSVFDIINFSVWVGISGSLGSLAAFIISMIISIKRGWFWMNPIIIIIATYIIAKFTSLGAQLLKPIQGLIGLTTNNPILEFAIYGALLLAIGVFIFFYPRFTRFIEKGSPQPVPERTA